MELTILLAQVFGLYFVIIGIIMLFKQNYIKSILMDFVAQPMLRFLIGALILIGGLFLIVSHNDWSTFATGLISLLGWLTAIKGVLYLTLSNEAVGKWVNAVYLRGKANLWRPLIALVIGIYLLNVGFGLF